LISNCVLAYTMLHVYDMHLSNNVVIFSHQQGRKRLEHAQDFLSRPRSRLVFLSSRRLETNSLVLRTTSLWESMFV